MAKNNKDRVGNPFDDDFDELTGTSKDPKGGDMSQFDDYVKFDVTAKSAKIEESVKQLIVKLADLHLQSGMIHNEDYIKAIASIEQQNLLVLCKQVYYAEHVVDTLIRRLDGGGFVDPDLYDQIRKMQASVISTTLEVSRYTRQLPEWFKYVAADTAKINALTIMETGSADTKQLTSSNTTGDTFTVTQPVRGTREMMLSINDSITDIDAKIASMGEIEPIPISLDEDEYDEELKEFEDEDE